MHTHTCVNTVRTLPLNSNVHSAAIRTYYFMLDSLPRFYQERTEDSERKESNEIQILNSYGTWNKKSPLGTFLMIAHTACKISDKCSKTMASKPIVVCIHFLKPHLPKMCDRHSLCYRLGSLGRWRFHEGKKKTLILESNINLTTACSQYQDKWICDETL